MTEEPRHGPNVLVREAASLFHLLGGMSAKHLVIVGGMVPPLLLPHASVPHVGSTDIDLCLSVAITEGATRDYYRSIEAIISPYFHPEADAGFRWRKRKGVDGVPLAIDFLGPSDQWARQEADGTRPLEDQTAADNAGLRLRPFPIRAGALIDRDAESRLVDAVPLVYQPGVRADVTIRFAGPVGLLAAKADALDKRSDTKDGYDVSWWCLNAAEAAGDVAQLIIDRPCFSDELFPESIALLRRAFRAPDYPGPTGYAAEAHPDLEPGDDGYELARNLAYSKVSEVLALLKANLW